MQERDKKIKSEMEKWMVELAENYNVGMTFQFNKNGITEAEVKRAIRVAFGTLYRKILGKKWYNKRLEQYPFIGFQEMGKSGMNRHYHLMLKMENINFCKLYQLICWLNKGVKKVVPSAKVDVCPLYNVKWGSYIVKEVNSNNNSLITEKDFW